jgi:hypothetical protein
MVTTTSEGHRDDVDGGLGPHEGRRVIVPMRNVTLDVLDQARMVSNKPDVPILPVRIPSHSPIIFGHESWGRPVDTIQHARVGRRRRALRGGSEEPPPLSVRRW